MKKLLELKEAGQLTNADLQSTSQDELFAVHIEVSKEEKPLNIVNFHSLGGRQPLTEDIKAMLAGEKGDIVLPEGDIAIPETYDENVAVGKYAHSYMTRLVIMPTMRELICDKGITDIVFLFFHR